MKDLYKILPKISVFIIISSLVLGMIVWLTLPDIIPAHFSPLSPDRSAGKMELLFCFLIPLFGFFRGEEKEYHVKNEETEEKMIKDMQKINLTQLITTMLSCGGFWFILVLVMINT